MDSQDNPNTSTELTVSDSMPTLVRRVGGNRRTGPSRGTKSGKRRGQLAWQKDPLIRDRVDLTRELMGAGKSTNEINRRVNEWLTERGELTISMDTTYLDRTRVLELYRTRDKLDAETITTRFERIYDLALDAFTSAPSLSLNRSAYLGIARATASDLAKLTGSIAPQKTEIKGEVRHLLEAIKSLPEPEE